MIKFKNKYLIPTTRLSNWDYSQNGIYFVTICVKNRENKFGAFQKGKLILNQLGKFAQQCWMAIPQHFPFVKIDQFVIMPDHVHGILAIDKCGCGRGCDCGRECATIETQNFASLPIHTPTSLPNPSISTKHKKTITKPLNKFGPQSQNLASIVRGFKIGVKKFANQNAWQFEWQPRFYDRIIKNEPALVKVRSYIQNNPYKHC